MPFPNNVVSFTVAMGSGIVKVSGIIKEITPEFITFTNGLTYARSAIKAPINQFCARKYTARLD